MPQHETCSRFGKWIGGCLFEARYDLSPADITSLESVKGTGAGSFLERFRAKTYVRDVCVRCGKTIERSST